MLLISALIALTLTLVFGLGALCAQIVCRGLFDA